MFLFFFSSSLLLFFFLRFDADDIPSGCDWHEEIGAGLQECNIFAAFITNKYCQSKYCKGELYVADGANKQVGGEKERKEKRRRRENRWEPKLNPECMIRGAV